MQVLEGLRKALPEYKIIKIQEEQYNDVFHLQKENIIYFQYTNEYPIQYKNIISEITKLPPNTTIDQKYYIGFYLDDTLVAIMDYIDGYPNNETYWIGLFILDINYQGLGIGTKIMNTFIELSDKNIQLGCLSNNKEGLAFWSKFGFKEIRKAHNKEKDWNIIVMEKRCHN